jgi:hypothetical protein
MPTTKPTPGEIMKTMLFLAAMSALYAQENIFLYGPGVQTVKVQNLMPGSNGAGVEFQSHDTSIGGSIHKTGAIYGIFDYALFDQGRITITTRSAGGMSIDTLTAKAGKVGIGTNHPQEKLDVRGTIKTEALKVGDQIGVSISCPTGAVIRQIRAGIIVDAYCQGN